MTTGTVLFQCVALAVLAYTLDATGPTLDTCSTVVCPPTSTCEDSMGYVSCLCPEGKTGVNCTQDDPCLPRLKDCPEGRLCFGTCEPNIYCEGATGYAHCRGCVLGYKGNDCLEDIDECTSYDDICQNNATCTNTVGGYSCKCTDGWVGKECDCKEGTKCDKGEMTDETKDTDTNVASSTCYNVALFCSTVALFAFLKTEMYR